MTAKSKSKSNQAIALVVVVGFVIGYFGKYHNSLCLSPQILPKHCFCFLLGPL